MLIIFNQPCSYFSSFTKVNKQKKKLNVKILQKIYKFVLLQKIIRNFKMDESEIETLDEEYLEELPADKVILNL